MEPPIQPTDIDAAAQRIEGAVLRTSCAVSRTLSDITGAEVVIKFENLQFTASYKERGALNRLLLLPEGTPGVVTSSAGNFAQAVAHHASRLGIPSVIVMPAITPSVKVTNTRQLGAEIVVHGDTLEDARDEADRIAHDRGFELLSPFNDVDVMAGQGNRGAGDAGPAAGPRRAGGAHRGRRTARRGAPSPPAPSSPTSRSSACRATGGRPSTTPSTERS